MNQFEVCTAPLSAVLGLMIGLDRRVVDLLRSSSCLESYETERRRIKSARGKVTLGLGAWLMNDAQWRMGMG